MANVVQLPNFGIPNINARVRFPAKKYCAGQRMAPGQGLALGNGQLHTLVGNHAVAWAVRQAMVTQGGGSTAAFPITPATEILHLIRYRK